MYLSVCNFLEDEVSQKSNQDKNIKILCFSHFSLHRENFMAIFTTLSVVISISVGTLGIFATLV